MKNRTVKIISAILASLMVFSVCNFSFASVYLNENLSNDSELFENSGFKEKEYTTEYKEWLSLNLKDRLNTLEPNKYDIDIADLNEYRSSNNVFRSTYLLGGTGATASSYDLRDVLPENSKVKNQENTQNCWAFASLASLESFLAMKDKKDSKSEVEYDFSEKHMAYATTRATFLNGAINEKGYTKQAEEGQHPASSSGNFSMALSYLTNGMGAVSETQMPFTVPYEDININEINNKTTVTTVIDAQIMGQPNNASERQALIQQIKQHIVNYGGVYAGIYGAQLLGSAYNNATGALYTNNAETDKANHAIEIVGWDDSYEVSNFNENMRPTNPGAFLIKNSWGTKFYISLTAAKQSAYNKYQAQFNSYGINSASEIPDDYCLESCKSAYGQDKVTIEGDNLCVSIGDNGYMYVSYEDANILKLVSFFEKVENYKKYGKIYQNEYFGAIRTYAPNSQVPKIYLANVYDNCTPNEEIDCIGISTLSNLNKCKVYINANDSDKSAEKLMAVELAEGEYENLTPGYHTIEFANPIKLTGTSFVVVVEISADDLGQISFPVLTKMEDVPQVSTLLENIVIPTGKCFLGYSANVLNNTWTDMAENGVVFPIKAYTVGEQKNAILSDIQITTQPLKRTYNAGDAFENDGMVVKAIYSDGTSRIITDYTVTNGASLEAEQTSVTISYTENGVTKITYQNITVNGASQEVRILNSISITTPPIKTTYIEGEDFDVDGMVVTARYLDNTTKTVTNYTVTDGTGLTKGKTSVTISYTEGGITKTAEQIITVKERKEGIDPEIATLYSIQVTTPPTKTTHNEGDSFDTSGMVIKAKYSDNSTKTITNYTVMDGNNLKAEQTEVTIFYTEGGITKSTSQKITVNKKQKNLPTLSDFSNAEANITKATSFTYVEKINKDDYTLIQVNLSGVKIGDTKSSRKYYYYLSNKKGETDINSSYWTEFELDGTDAKLTIDTRDLSYADKLKDGENVFLYIKEVATLDGETTNMISTVQLNNKTDLVVYVDDEIYEGLGSGNGSEKKKEDGNSIDGTTAKGNIPQTGSSVLITIVIIISVIGIGSFAYIRYKNIDK